MRMNDLPSMWDWNIQDPSREASIHQNAIKENAFRVSRGLKPFSSGNAAMDQYYDESIAKGYNPYSGTMIDQSAVRNANPLIAAKPAQRSVMPQSAPVQQRIAPSAPTATSKSQLPYPWNVLQGMRGMHGLGQFEIASAAMKLLGPAIAGGANGTGGAGAPTNVNTVSTSVQTAVSPQISPVFVQQSNPSNSPVSTGVTQSSPSPMSATMPGQPAYPSPAPYGTTPVTGAMPGFDSASGFLPTGLPALPSSGLSMGDNTGTYIALAVLIGGALVIRSRRHGKTRKGRK